MNRIWILCPDFLAISWLRFLHTAHDEWESSLRKIGFFLGKFIYLMDAYDDVEKTSNPAAIIHSGRHTWTILHFADDCRSLLTLMMSECSREFEQLPILLHAEILRNVLYSEVWSRYTAVTSKDS